MTIKILNALIAVVGGVVGAIVIYWVLNKLAELLPGRWEDRVKPYLFLLPAIAAIGLYLIYPTIQTVVYSFANAGSTEFVGLDNYTNLLSSSSFQNTLFNTLLWILVVPAGTIVLGLSTSLAVSLAALVVMGAGDMVSMYIRHLVVQLVTPDEIRGRVSAVNAVFIGASNELGEFESGVTAAWWGVVRSVVIGGIATLVVAGVWSRLFPQLSGLDRFPEAEPQATAREQARPAPAYDRIEEEPT